MIFSRRVYGKAGRVVFELTEANVLLVHKNERLEKHGEEDRLACNLNFQYEMANTGLAMFAPALRSCLYQKPQGAQQEIDVDADYMPSLRFPALSVLKWGSGDLVGPELRFHYGTTEKSHIVFEAGVKVGKYRMECKEGGTVLLSFHAQVYPNEKQSGQLSKILLDKSCIISITPPEGDEPAGE